MNTKERAFGRWRQILLALKVPGPLLKSKAQACPFCGGKDRFIYDDKHGHGNYFCRQCGAGDGFHLLQKLNDWDFIRACREVDGVLGELPVKKQTYNRTLISWKEIMQLWQQAKPLQEGDPATSYLLRRGLNLASWPKALRYMAGWKHSPSQKYLPCMFALFSDPNGTDGTIHRTYLHHVTPNRMFLPTRVPLGGAIRLFAAEPTMGVAEGIETALSASLIFKMPVWAVTSERLLRQWEPPATAKHVTVFGDNDKNYVGHSAAYDLANRLVLRQKLDVRVEIPMTEGWDWNDVIKDNQRDEAPAQYERDKLAMQKLRSQDSAAQSAGEPVSDAGRGTSGSAADRETPMG
jgi:putative DNA primase/helicase